MSPRGVSARQLSDFLGEWRASSRPDYVALADRIRLLVIDGRLKAATGLPSERELAERLTVSRTTVNSAFAALRGWGYLRSRRGSGSVITVPGHSGYLPALHDGGLIDLSRATSTAVPGFQLAADRAMNRLPALLGTDGYELAGYPDLRKGIADRYCRAGVPTSAEQVLITNGSAGAITLLARTIVTPGDRVIVETPGYPHSNDAFRSGGARLVPVAVDGDEGWDIEAMEHRVARSVPALMYLMPDFHNPTSRSMTTADRARVVAAAASQETVIVSDDTTSELDIDRGWTVPPLAAFGDRRGTVISVGSASKTIWGGLRIRWIRANRSWIDRLLAARLSYDLGAAVIEQLIVTELLDTMDEVLAYRRNIHAASRGMLITTIAERMPDARVRPVDGGIAAWVHLGSAVSSALTDISRDRGLLIGPGPWFGVSGEFERHIRVPITAIPEDINRAISILAESLSEAERRTRVSRA